MRKGQCHHCVATRNSWRQYSTAAHEDRATKLSFANASTPSKQKDEDVMPIMLNTVPLQYQVTHHNGSFQMDTQLGTQEKANTWLN
jgi:hypothetical protein